MDPFYRPTYAEVSLDALQHNIAAFRHALPKEIAIMAVVKADAYGHGAVEVAKQAMQSGADYLAVAFLDEALELRQAGIDAPILALGYTPPEGLEPARKQRITVTAYSQEIMDAMERISASAAGQPDEPKLHVHVKIDTGMGRIGLHREEEAIRYIERALSLPGIQVEGVFTHYANADEEDKSYTLEQHRKFMRVVRHFTERGSAIRFFHAGNSATAIDTPELACNMVRLGISMYGLYPSAEVNRNTIELQPVMSLKTGIVHLKTLPPNSGISYGTIYYTSKDEAIATLPIGYADGFSRMLTGKAEALVRGRRVPIVGRICMDQCMANVSSVPDASMGDEVVLIGRQGAEEISADEVAAWLGTINYEVTCMVSHRVPRVYIREGKPVRTINPLLRHRFHTFTM
ncbi:alanine racemase [Gordoniibacillus kamchatkensis]|uniref:Alanine racemase n=1 Tax=Gordoniibacillus kamchatkensis TaxID=1590651 RepID=A0ABR5ACK2_9BACL|nr:alanine racemase [Paenibacillus sp. VKM B-2647]KIL38732.1 alanine racemase [Paenibacillus sp. VKM B-2647]